MDQAKGSAFFRHRAGRVGASKCRAASHTDPSQPSQSLVKAICYPDIFRFSTAATRYGCKHEDIAIAEYEKTMRKTHANFVITKCGTIINKKYQFLHATPDFLCECDCCGQGCGEIPVCIVVNISLCLCIKNNNIQFSFCQCLIIRIIAQPRPIIKSNFV